jgi:hypothetical protein
MIKTAFLLTLTVTTIASMPAQAQRVFVSAHGVDTNPGTAIQPCRTFQQAFNTVPRNGEIDVLDPRPKYAESASGQHERSWKGLI